MSATPTLLSQAPASELKQVRGICLDIDETLSTRGKLTAEAYRALWRLKQAGYFVVPITGRPAGWCDMIARFWPVDAVVGENGAFTFYMHNGVRRRLNTLEDRGNAESLKRLGEAVRARFPHAKWASDQAYREYDLAIDFCEDVPPWPRSDIDELVKLCEREGAHAKVSSIHVNAWFGNYDKKSGFRRWLACEEMKAQALPGFDEWLFIGDSPNDEPMFEGFRYSVGVANLRNFIDRLKHPPRWLTTAESGAGFEEMANVMVALKAGVSSQAGAAR